MIAAAEQEALRTGEITRSKVAAEVEALETRRSALPTTRRPLDPRDRPAGAAGLDGARAQPGARHPGLQDVAKPTLSGRPPTRPGPFGPAEPISGRPPTELRGPAGSPRPPARPTSPARPASPTRPTAASPRRRRTPAPQIRSPRRSRSLSRASPRRGRSSTRAQRATTVGRSEAPAGGPPVGWRRARCHTRASIHNRRSPSSRPRCSRSGRATRPSRPRSTRGGGCQRRQRVRLLRRPSVRQRPAPLRPPAHRLREGCGAPVPDDAGPAGGAPLRLGLPRAAGRGGGREGARVVRPARRSSSTGSTGSTTRAARPSCGTPTSGSATSPVRLGGSTSTTTTRPSTSRTWRASCGPSSRSGTRA